jgi:hypothetical protein
MEASPHLRAIQSLAPETAQTLLGELVAFVRPRFPYVVDRARGEHRPFDVYGPALIADAIATVEGIAHLAQLQREADAHSLLRDLVESTITFAWLAIDPKPHIEAWLLEDKKKRLQAANALRTFGEELLETSFRQTLEADVQSGGPPLPGVADRAKKADQHWTPRIPRLERVIEGGRVFELLYELIFRYTSSFTHSMPMAVNKLIEPVKDGVAVVLEGTTGPQRALTFAPSLFGALLYVASEALGWPSTHDVDSAFDRAVGPGGRAAAPA